MALVIDIKVVPRSRKQCCKRESDRLKCYLKSPPEKGRANKELVQFLAKSLSLSATHISIISGQTARLKRIRIESDLSFDTLCETLGIENQLSLW